MQLLVEPKLSLNPVNLIRARLRPKVLLSLTRISRQAMGKWVNPTTAQNNLFVKEEMSMLDILEINNEGIRDIFHHLRDLLDFEMLRIVRRPQPDRFAIVFQRCEQSLDLAVHRRRHDILFSE